MGKMLERKCRYCGNVYKYEGAVNFIAFCPYCKRYDFSEPKNGCGSNTPCRIYIGDKTIGEVKGDGKSGYDLLVPEFAIYEKLNKKVSPMTLAINIVNNKLNRECGYMDFLNGELLLLGERFRKGYTFKQFKNSPLYCGQNGERHITLQVPYFINNKSFNVSLLFRQGFLNLISLCCNMPNICFENESNRKELHDNILSEYGISDNEQFLWGSIFSVYDAKSNVSSINIEFYYDEDELPMFYNSDISFDKTRNGV